MVELICTAVSQCGPDADKVDIYRQAENKLTFL